MRRSLPSGVLAGLFARVHLQTGRGGGYCRAPETRRRFCPPNAVEESGQDVSATRNHSFHRPKAAWALFTRPASRRFSTALSR